MNKKRVIALLTASVLAIAQAVPISASQPVEETVTPVSESGKDYTVKAQDAIYLEDGFEGEVSYTSSGTGSCEVVAHDADKGRVLSVSGEKIVSYAFKGSVVKWDGASVSTSFLGEGTETSPYLIKTGADLKFLSNKVKSGNTYSGKYFKLVNNIDLNNVEWEPIGNRDYKFSGIFDGNYNKVLNIKRTTFTNNSNEHFGFFGDVQNGVIKNFGVENVEFVVPFATGQQFIGGIAGVLSGTVDNCYVRNIYVKSEDENKSISHIGGLIGYVRALTTIENSYAVDFEFTAAYSKSDARISALCGCLQSSGGLITMNNCYVAGDYVLNGNFANYYAIAMVDKYSNIKNSNNYVAHGVEEFKSTLTQREIDFAVVTDSKMKTLAKDLGGAFKTDATGLSNKGYPYHSKCLEIPDEVRIAFDIDFATSSEIAFKVINAEGELCITDSIENTFESGWHRVAIDMQAGKYTVYVDGNKIKEADALETIGHSEIEFNQMADKTYYIDNISIEKDFSAEIEKNADDIMAYIKSDISLDNITGNIDLPESINGSAITWSTSDDRIVGDDGEVKRRAVKLPVTLTAKFDAKSTASIAVPSAIMEFVVNVAPAEGATDASKVSDIVKYYLTDTFISDESLNAVTKNLNTLPTEYEGAKITWSSSDTTVVSNDGKVTRPEMDADDSEVTLTVTVDINGETSNGVFGITVLAPLSDTAKLKLAAAALTDNKLTNEEINKITQNLTLPRKGLYDTTITWSWASGDETAIDNEGNVTRGEADAFVQLKATFELNGETFDKVFSFNVLMSETAAAQQDAELISEIPEETDTDFELPVSGAKHSSGIEWTSSDSAITIEDGYAIVTRPANTAEDKTVTLTATVTYGGASVTENFFVKVLKMPADAELISAALGNITWDSISPDLQTDVRSNLSLIKDCGDGVVAQWSCTPGLIDENGIVTRPAFGTADVDAELTVTVSAEGTEIEPQSKTFPITIKAFSSLTEAITKANDELSFSILSNDPIDCLFNNLYLPTAWRYGSTVSWTSDDERIRVSEAEEIGYVTPVEFGTENAPVKLTANLSLDGISTAKNFFVTLAESDGIKEDFYHDYENFTMGEISSTGNLATNKAYVGSFITEDPINRENQVLMLHKDSTYVAYADRKAFTYKVTKERIGSLEFLTKIYFQKLPDKHLGINLDFNTGQEIELKFTKTADGVSILGKSYPLNEWHDFRFCVDTRARTYSVYMNDEFIGSGTLKYADTKDTERILYNIYFAYPYGSAVDEHIVYLDDTKFIKNVYSRDYLAEASTRFETAFRTSQDIKNITEDLVIPRISVTEVTVETRSSNTAVITDDGKVTRPLSGDVTVDFTVVYKSDYGNTREKIFTLVVKGGASNVEDNEVCINEDLTSAYNYINENQTLNYITADLSLIKEVVNGSVISYSSSDTAVVANDGKVTRPTDTDKNITLTVTATRNGVSESKTVTLTVKAAIQSPVVIIPSGNTGGLSKVPTGGGLGAPATQLPSPDDKTQTSSAIFSDISSHWAKDYIEMMYEAGVVNGNDDGTFAPDQTVTREAFITMLVRALNLELSTDNGVFTDVNENDWFAPFVNTAFKNNIVSGISETEFGITRNISRQDMCVMVYNALKEKLENSEADTAFADDENISDYAKEAVYALKENGIVNGRDNNNFVPSGTATRAEAAKIICSIKKAFID